MIRVTWLLLIGVLFAVGCGPTEEPTQVHRMMRPSGIEPPSELVFPDPPPIPERLLGPSPPIADEPKD